MAAGVPCAEAQAREYVMASVVLNDAATAEARKFVDGVVASPSFQLTPPDTMTVMVEEVCTALCD